MSQKQTQDQLAHIAIVGMAGRFPGARDTEQFWNNLRDGVESIARLPDKDLLAAGVDPRLLESPAYVKASPILDGIEYFDAEFFEFSPREAEVTDPQHRIFLECAWEALEHAGYDPARYQGRIGVFAGAGLHSYYHDYLLTNEKLVESLGALPRFLAVEKDFLSTRVSYRLNLKGPSISLQTACSTSLVAVHLGCQSLLNGESDIVLAGGVSIKLPQTAGYSYQEGTIVSPDGHCRAFDAAAAGTVFGSGAGIVVLKRLEDALCDGDTIHAVIRGSCINNDGAIKVSYTAPSVDGQARAVSEALAMADVAASEISYVETHGSGTSLGDPIEVAALTKAFRQSTEQKAFCGIGSVKTNVGHLDAAAGIAGLIKLILSLEHRQLPPSLHFKKANPVIDFPNTPFFVQNALADWQPRNGRRVAGISSFGIGGTNAHLVVEEAPSVPAPIKARRNEVIVISARTQEALDSATDRLVAHLRCHSDISLGDVAFTLQQGRRAFSCRRAVVASSIGNAADLLEKREAGRVRTAKASEISGDVVFMLPGQGAQHANMARALYEEEPTFRSHIDQCSEILMPHLGMDLRTALYPTNCGDEADDRLRQTRITQPAVFVTTYALAQLWQSWGIVPKAMIGHSLGEYVAATLAGVFKLEDALTLVAKRARLMQQLPSGSMLAVHAPEEALRHLVSGDISVAAVNAPHLTVLSGPTEAIDSAARLLVANGTTVQPLATSHAFHSSMMNPILEEFEELVASVPRQEPQIPFVSTLTGDWITAAQATDPNYWSQQVRGTVRFSPALHKLLNNAEGIFLEVGPGSSLSALASTQVHPSQRSRVLHSLPHQKDTRSAHEHLLTTVCALWTSGVPIDWIRLNGRSGRRIPLPTYPFERKRYWIEPQSRVAWGKDASASGPIEASPDTITNTRSRRSDERLANETSDDLQRGSVVALVPQHLSIESELMRLWRDALGVSEIGLDDDFFRLGGQSLLALSLITQIGSTFGARFSLASLLAAPTARSFALVVESALSGKDSNSADSSLCLIVEAVRSFILENYGAGRDGNLDNTGSLLRMKLIDQMDFLQIALFLQETYGFTVEDRELTVEHLASVDSIASFVTYKLKERKRSDSVPVSIEDHRPIEIAG